MEEIQALEVSVGVDRFGVVYSARVVMREAPWDGMRSATVARFEGPGSFDAAKDFLRGVLMARRP